jgi:hypothetical protein
MSGRSLTPTDFVLIDKQMAPPGLRGEARENQRPPYPTANKGVGAGRILWRAPARPQTPLPVTFRKMENRGVPRVTPHGIMKSSWKTVTVSNLN